MKYRKKPVTRRLTKVILVIAGMGFLASCYDPYSSPAYQRILADSQNCNAGVPASCIALQHDYAMQQQYDQQSFQYTEDWKARQNNYWNTMSTNNAIGFASDSASMDATINRLGQPPAFTSVYPSPSPAYEIHTEPSTLYQTPFSGFDGHN